MAAIARADSHLKVAEKNNKPVGHTCVASVALVFNSIGSHVAASSNPSVEAYPKKLNKMN